MSNSSINEPKSIIRSFIVLLLTDLKIQVEFCIFYAKISLIESDTDGKKLKLSLRSLSTLHFLM